MTARGRWAGPAMAAVVVGPCIVAAVLLWPTSVPGDLQRPELAASDEFAAGALDRAEDFQTLLRWTFLASQAVLVAVLALYARHGARFARESAAGPIGTGFLLGMLGLAFLWLAQLPFHILEFWWYRHYDVVDSDWAAFLFGDWLSLAGQFIFACGALLVAMGLARWLPRLWPLPATAVFAGLIVLFLFVAPWLVSLDRAPPALRAEAAQLARQVGVEDVPLRIEDVGQTQPNAYAFGLGPSRRVVLWDSILDYPRGEVRAVLAHEYAHHARAHLLKGVGWGVLLLAPTVLVVAFATRRRGGLATPEAVPLALLVVVVLGLLTSPLQSAASRRYEAEADWSALQATRDPRAMAGLFRNFTRDGLSDPDPPGWFHALFDSHPSTLERIEMAQAWAARRGR